MSTPTNDAASTTEPAGTQPPRDLDGETSEPTAATTTPPDERTADASRQESTTGQHAAPRPYPPSSPSADEATARPGPDALQAAETSATSGQAPTERPADTRTTASLADTRTTASLADTRTTASTDESRRDPRVEEPTRDLPERPERPGMGRHLIAALLGLVLTPLALTMIGIGTARLADIAGTTDMGTDALGATLLTLGVLMLAIIVLLGIWSAALPVIGGLVWGIGLGLAYLVVPTTMRDGAEAMTSDGSVPVEVEQLAAAGMNGSLLVLGALLVAAGLATSIARRRGRRYAERVAVAENAQAEAEREDALRRTT